MSSRNWNKSGREESDFPEQAPHFFDSTRRAPWLVWMNECVNEWRVSTKTSSTHCQPLLIFKAVSSANASANICPTRSHTCSAVNNHFAGSLTVGLAGTHTYTHIHIHAIKSLTKVLRSPSLYDCTSCIGGHFFLHPVACLNILAWLCIIQAEENNRQYSFWNRNLTVKWNQSETLDSSQTWVALRRI